MKRNEAIILIVIIGLSLACIISTKGGSTLILQDESLPAHLYSNILAGILIAAAVARLAVLFFAAKTRVEEGEAVRGVFSRSTLLIAGCSVLYTLGITYVGFYISTFLCMIVLYLGFENWRKSELRTGLLFSLALCLVFFISFYFLKIYLPDGLLF
jgi:hypothetical protein